MNSYVKILAWLMLMMCGGQTLTAQERAEAATPKWATKVQKSILSVISYDQNKEMLHSGTGVCVSSDGIVVADYAVLRDAWSAVVVDQSGNKYDVERILGADDTYGVVRFKTAARKVPALTPAPSSAGTDGTTVYALGYSKTKQVTCPSARIEKKEVVDARFAYYTLTKAFKDAATGYALFDADGQWLGLVQSPIRNKSYAIDARFGTDLSIAAIQSKSASLALNCIHIRKGIPETAEEALVYIYFQSRSANNDDYIDMLNLFVQTYPDNAEGYLRRVTPLTDMCRFDEAEADMQTYLRLAADKMAAHGNVANALYTKLLYQPEPAYEKWNYDLAVDHVNQALSLANEMLQGASTDSLRRQAEANVLQYQLQKAQILMAKADERGALAIYEALNSGPYRSAGTLYAASMAHEAAGDSLDIAIALMDSAIATFPEPMPQEAANYVMRRGQLYAKVKRYRDAVKDYNQYCYLNNNKVSAQFYYDRSALEVEARMYQQAIDDINQAIALSPRTVLFYVEKSGIQLRVNMLDDCIATARQALALDANNADALRIQGYAQLQKGDRAAARQSLDAAVALGDVTAKEIIEKYMK